MIICIWYMCSSNACIAWTDTSVSTAPSLHNYTQLEFTPRQYIGRLHCVQFERSILQNHWSLKLSSTGFLMVEKNWQASLCQQALEHEAIRLCFKHERLGSIFVRHLKMYIKEFVRARAVLKAAALNTIFQLRVWKCDWKNWKMTMVFPYVSHFSSFAGDVLKAMKPVQLSTMKLYIWSHLCSCKILVTSGELHALKETFSTRANSIRCQSCSFGVISSQDTLALVIEIKAFQAEDWPTFHSNRMNT